MVYAESLMVYFSILESRRWPSVGKYKVDVASFQSLAVPELQVKNPSARVEHEASTSKIGEDQLFYFQQRGIDREKAVAAMVGGFGRDVFDKLPLQFSSEVYALMNIELKGSVG